MTKKQGNTQIKKSKDRIADSEGERRRGREERGRERETHTETGFRTRTIFP